MPSIGLRTRRRGALVDITVLLGHPMESGLRVDREGIRIPAWEVTHLDVRLNSTPIGTLEIKTGVSRNPALSLTLAGAEAGDVLTVEWRDNRRQSGSRSVTLE